MVYTLLKINLPLLVIFGRRNHVGTERRPYERDRYVCEECYLDYAYLTLYPTRRWRREASTLRNLFHAHPPGWKGKPPFIGKLKGYVEEFMNSITTQGSRVRDAKVNMCINVTYPIFYT